MGGIASFGRRLYGASAERCLGGAALRRGRALSLPTRGLVAARSVFVPRGLARRAAARAMFFCIAAFANCRAGARGRTYSLAGENVRAAADVCPLRAVCAKQARESAAGIALCDG
ncbi:hypothetical protein ACI2IY_14795 [Lysobacter enzymogenes]|uniref:hypothetical protein n=1 Tax=Lysobacter enzymogenes TaxID=69 RepID=UPI00384DEBE0